MRNALKLFRPAAAAVRTMVSRTPVTKTYVSKQKYNQALGLFEHVNKTKAVMAQIEKLATVTVPGDHIAPSAIAQARELFTGPISEHLTPEQLHRAILDAAQHLDRTVYTYPSN